MKNFRKVILVIFFSLALGAPSLIFAQASAGGATTNSPLEIKNAVGEVLLAGLVGGVLGLSTLPFYANPEDNIRNIYFGAGAGAILMTLVMTFSVATSPIPQNLNSPTGRLDPWLSEKNQLGLAYNLNF
jgi:hypothetical protein